MLRAAEPQSLESRAHQVPRGSGPVALKFLLCSPDTTMSGLRNFGGPQSQPEKTLLAHTFQITDGTPEA